jgi:hypothetical protein
MHACAFGCLIQYKYNKKIKQKEEKENRKSTQARTCQIKKRKIQRTATERRKKQKQKCKHPPRSSSNAHQLAARVRNCSTLN